jgi:hypothetical protein
MKLILAALLLLTTAPGLEPALKDDADLATRTRPRASAGTLSIPPENTGPII